MFASRRAGFSDGVEVVEVERVVEMVRVGSQNEREHAGGAQCEGLTRHRELAGAR